MNQLQVQACVNQQVVDDNNKEHVKDAVKNQLEPSIHINNLLQAEVARKGVALSKYLKEPKSFILPPQSNVTFSSPTAESESSKGELVLVQKKSPPRGILPTTEEVNFVIVGKGQSHKPFPDDIPSIEEAPEHTLGETSTPAVEVVEVEVQPQVDKPTEVSSTTEESEEGEEVEPLVEMSPSVEPANAVEIASRSATELIMKEGDNVHFDKEDASTNATPESAREHDPATQPQVLKGEPTSLKTPQSATDLMLTLLLLLPTLVFVVVSALVHKVFHLIMGDTTPLNNPTESVNENASSDEMSISETPRSLDFCEESSPPLEELCLSRGTPTHSSNSEGDEVPSAHQHNPSSVEGSSQTSTVPSRRQNASSVTGSPPMGPVQMPDCNSIALQEDLIQQYPVPIDQGTKKKAREKEKEVWSKEEQYAPFVGECGPGESPLCDIVVEAKCSPVFTYTSPALGYQELPQDASIVLMPSAGYPEEYRKALVY